MGYIVQKSIRRVITGKDTRKCKYLVIVDTGGRKHSSKNVT